MVRMGFAVALLVILVVPVLADTDGAPPKPLTATPSLLGPTGCIVTPTTEIADNTLAIAGHWVQDTYDATAKFNYAPIKELEIGASWFNFADSTSKSKTAFSAKYRIVQEGKKTPSVAVGIFDVADAIDFTPYAVVSKTFGTDVPVIINLGGGFGDRIINGFFANMAIRLRPQVDAIVEYDTEGFNFGVRFRPVKGMTLDLLSVDNGTAREFGAGASYIAQF